MRKLAAAAVTAAMLLAMLVVGTGTASAATPCDEGHWPASVQDRPATFHAGGTAGYYIWHDRYGWHLRTTTPSRSPHSFTGKIVSSDNMRVVKTFRDEGRDTVTTSGHTISFSFVTYNGVDGVDFKVGCTRSVTFLLKSGGRWTPVRIIFLGYRGHARSNPFTVYRVS